MTKVQFPLAPPSFLVKLGGFKAFKKESQMKKIKELINFSGDEDGEITESEPFQISAIA